MSEHKDGLLAEADAENERLKVALKTAEQERGAASARHDAEWTSENERADAAEAEVHRLNEELRATAGELIAAAVERLQMAAYAERAEKAEAELCSVRESERGHAASDASGLVKEHMAARAKAEKELRKLHAICERQIRVIERLRVEVRKAHGSGS